jgi:hypothetical protein
MSTLKTISALNPEVDALETVRGHMLTICGGVRQRALEAADGADEATVEVDALIAMINEYFDYSASPMFPAVELVQR